MRVIIVDDEQLAIDNLVRMLGKYNVDIVATHSNPHTALELFDQIQADVAFLDIEMPEYNGFALAERIRAVCPHMIIVFVTAYDHYAVAAFALETADYLLKPVMPERLDHTMNRLNKLINSEARSAAHLQVCFLYAIRLVDEQGKTRDLQWRTTKTKELFAYLVHMRAQTIMRDTIIELLWPGLEFDKALANLNTTLYQLRNTLKQADAPIQIAYRARGYQLLLNGVSIDTEQWERELEVASSPDKLQQMFRLLMVDYRGEYLQQEAYLWAEPERERLRAKWLAYALIASRRLEQEGAFGDAV